MSGEGTGSITQLVDRLSAGDRAAADRLVQLFLPRLVALAAKTLSSGAVRFAGPEDAVQSALLSFWNGAQRGAFEQPLHRDQLWNLLGLITVCKVRKQLRRERAKKRGGGRVLAEGDLAAVNANGNALRLDELLAEMPAQDFDLHCDELLARLDDDLRQIAVLRLLGYSTAEIAGQLNCTQRKVQRKLALVGLHWQQELSP